jgi:hypothetical protein
MPTEGSIVTPERHEIVALGAEGKAMDASNYLKYFERRVMAGLGISDVALGRGDSSNRATSSTLDKVMTDRCKDFQAVIEDFINEYVFKEMLYEGGFIIDEEEDSFVKLKFREIDIDFMLKTQNHSVFKYEHHAITEKEMRDEISRDPIADDQREEMYLQTVEEPKAEISAEAQLFSTEAKAEGRFNVMSKVKAKGVGKSGGTPKSSAKLKKSTNNREKPTNQHGTKPARTAEKKDYSSLAALIDHMWYLTKLDVIDMANDMEDWHSITPERINKIIDITSSDLKQKTEGLNIDHEMLDAGIKNSFNSLVDLLCRNINNTDVKGDLVFKISGVFESLRFELEDISEKVTL